METVILDKSGKQESCILLDDVNKKRWKIVFKVYQAVKLTVNECTGFNFLKGGDLDDACFIDGESHPISRCFIMEVEDSEWIKDLKEKLSKVDPSADFMDKAKHFLLPLYDHIIEIIAWDIKIVEV
jgi:hypothetical protein